MSDVSAAAEQQQSQQPPDPTAWGQPISAERKTKLDALLERQRAWAEQPAETRGRSVFRRVELTGADVFWLAIRTLAGSEAPVDALTDAARRLLSPTREERVNLDLTALHLEFADLTWANLEGAILDGANLQLASLWEAHLEEASLIGTHLEHAILDEAHLERANLFGAHLEGALLLEAHLEGALLNKAHLERAGLGGAHLERANLTEAHLEHAGLPGAHLEGAILREAHLERAGLSGAHLERANLEGAYLESAFLSKAHLEGASLIGTLLEGADLTVTHLEGADLTSAHLEGADLREAFFDSSATLHDAKLTAAFSIATRTANSGSRIADVRWGGVNLATLNWTPFTERGVLIGDERTARSWRPKPYQEAIELKSASRQQRTAAKRRHATNQRREKLDAWATAARANRQLATALRDQGMSDEADHFAYRAQVTQRRVLQIQGKHGQALFSRFLNLLAGYGYKPERTLITYLAMVVGFALAYWLVGPIADHPFAPDGALVFSVTSFHGRGFFPGGLDLEDWITRLAALEAIVGLLIEISFIATFTQRYFGAK